MTEDDARTWFDARYPPEVVATLERFVALLREEADRQSLIARSTFDQIWARHLLDSAQLSALAADSRGPWLDIGSGGGLPGLVLAVLDRLPVTLVEPRKLRAEFLTRAAQSLQLDNVTVQQCKVQNLAGRFAVVTARAVAPISQLFTWTRHLVSRETKFLLPRGQTAHAELANARHSWHGVFHVEQSMTNPDSGIIVATAVRLK